VREAVRPWVIGHRGASGLRPEHSLAAYATAIDQGADFVEPDLVFTRDGALVARHENELSGTTDIADRPQYAGRRTTKEIDGRTVCGWFSEDFTLAEWRTLRARERLGALRPASAAFDGRFGLVTLEDVIALAAERSRSLGRPVGVVAELKHAAYFDAIGLPFEPALLAILDRHGVGGESPFFIESFDSGVLQRLRARTDVRLVQLIDESMAAMATPGGLARIATYADAIGPAKSLIVPRDGQGRSLEPTSLVADAHAAGLLVFVWTFRSENLFLPAELRRGDDVAAQGDAGAEYRLFFELGVDALFSDFPAEALAARSLIAPPPA
jgi:glycerophosphoryl diester phosphodiesterase